MEFWKEKIVISRDIKFQDTLKQETRSEKDIVNLTVNKIEEDLAVWMK